MGELIGRLTTPQGISGRLAGSVELKGKLANPPAEPLPPEYTGQYIYTPTLERQTVDIAGQTATDNIIINPIPTPDYYWLGLEVENLGEVFSDSHKLSGTLFNGWTPSTTAKVIIANTSIGTFAADMENYEYWLKWDIDSVINYNAGFTKKVATERQVYTLWQSLHRRPYGFANIEANEDNYNYCTTAFSGSSYIVYYNSAGTRTWASGVSYGIYGAAQGATFSSTSSLRPTVTMKSPPISARCNTTYFSTAAAAAVDQDASTIKRRGYLFRVKQGSSDCRQFHKEAIDIYNNPL